MEIWHGYNIRLGRFVRRIFFAAFILPCLAIPLTLVAGSLAWTAICVFFALVAFYNYRHMRRFTFSMEKWITRLIRGRARLQKKNAPRSP